MCVSVCECVRSLNNMPEHSTCMYETKDLLCRVLQCFYLQTLND